MKKRSIILLASVITLVIISAFGLTKKTLNTKITEVKTDSTVVQLSDLNINGGINIDIRTGKKTEFVAGKNKSNLVYTIRGGTNRGLHRPITRQNIIAANSISDIIENYPNNWIKNYNSVAISAIGNGETKEAIGKSAELTSEQKELLKNASEIHIAVHYQKKNYNDEIQNRQMNTSFIIIPETQAEFKGGYDNLISYLKENSLNEINSKNLMMPQPLIYFVVDENGKIENTELTETSGNEEIDKMLVKMLKNMPKWTPAKNADGIAVKQKLALDIGMDGC
jgi:hypothetical protein